MSKKGVDQGLSEDFRVLQTYEELGEMVEAAITDALLPRNEMEPPPDNHEEAWVEEIAKKARAAFLMHLDAAPDDTEELREVARLLDLETRAGNKMARDLLTALLKDRTP